MNVNMGTCPIPKSVAPARKMVFALENETVSKHRAAGRPRLLESGVTHFETSGPDRSR